VNKLVLLSATTILVTAIATAVLWPDTPGSPGKVGGAMAFPRAAVAGKTNALPASDESAEEQRIPQATIRKPVSDLQAIQKRLEEGQKQYAENARANLLKSLQQRYTELGKALDLTPEEMTRILDTLAKFQVEPELLPEDLRRYFLNGTNLLAVPDPAMEQLRGSLVMTQRQEAELRSVLGDKYDKWLAIGLTPEVRTTVMRFQDVFGPDANPLSDEQTESLVAALAAEQVRIHRDMSNIPRPYGNDPQSRLQNELDRVLRYNAENNRRLVMTAIAHLNAGQLIDYREMLQQDMDKSIASLRAQIKTQETIRGNLGHSGASAYNSDGRILRARP
jgi:hypothetical protein